MSAIKNIITTYKEGKNLELEIRLKNVDKETFLSMYKNIKESDKFSFIGIENSINTITQTISGERYKKNAHFIRQQIFEGIKKISDLYYKKSQIGQPLYFNDFLKYSINLSEELLIDSFNMPTDAFVRIKRRAMFRYGVWRFDLTLVRAQRLQIIGPSLVKLKRDIFSGKDFLDLDLNAINDYSIEIEHMPEEKIAEDDFAVVKTLFSLSDKDIIERLAYEEELLTLARLLVKNKERLRNFKDINFKKITNQVIELNKTIYKKIFPPIDFFITEKADGVRAIVYVKGENGFIIDGTTIAHFATPPSSKLTIIDCERVDKNKFLAFDVMYFNNEDLTNKPFEERLNNLKEAAALINEFVSVEPKKFIRIGAQEEIAAAIDAVYDKKKYKYEIDGIIMTAPNNSYYNTKSYKWKPLERLSIDFLAKKVPSELLGKIPFIEPTGQTLYALFVGIQFELFTLFGLSFLPKYEKFFKKSSAAYFPIQFSPSINPLAFIYKHKGANINNKIIELQWSNGDWKFIKVRDDKPPTNTYFGNDFKVAEQTFQNFYVPFDIGQLSKPEFGYFNANKKDSIYYYPDKFKRFAINKVFEENIKKGDIVIDLAAGRGGDILRLRELGVSQVVAIDKDAEAIGELTSRKYTYKGRSTPMMIYTIIKDLNSPHDEILAEINKFNIVEANVIICNFAIHYFCDTVRHIELFIILVSKLLKVGGVFIFVTLNGQELFKKLEDIKTGEHYKIIEQGVEKYNYKKKYTAKKLLNVGQIIGVKMPFSLVDYDEPLANIDYIIKLCKKYKMESEHNCPIMEYFNDYINMDKLTDEDKKILIMTNYVVVRKIK